MSSPGPAESAATAEPAAVAEPPAASSEPAASRAPTPPHGRLNRIVAWVRRHSGLVAGLVGLYAVFRLLRGAAVFGWLFRDLLPVGDAVGWIGEHPWAIVAACIVVFALAAGGARLVIGWLGRRSDARRTSEAHPEPDRGRRFTAAPASGTLQAGDPLARG